jgi:hypothetical protein
MLRILFLDEKNCYDKILYIYAKGFRHFIYVSNIELQWITKSRQKSPKIAIVNYVTIPAVKKVIMPNIY